MPLSGGPRFGVHGLGGDVAQHAPLELVPAHVAHFRHGVLVGHAQVQDVGWGPDAGRADAGGADAGAAAVEPGQGLRRGGRRGHGRVPGVVPQVQDLPR